jgi:hypothetical protein
MSESVEAKAILKDRSNKRKLRELQEYLKQDIPDSVSEKTGRAGVVRLAINMAHERMKKNQEDLQASRKDHKKVQNRIKSEAKNI